MVSGSAIGWLVSLVLVFTAKHLVADFLLQTRWIALGKDSRSDWLRPLAAHVAVHAAGTLAIALAVAPRLWWLALVDLALHFAIDRAKCLAAQWGRWTTQDAPYWWLFGFDQFLHQVTNVILAAGLVTI